MQQEKDTTTEQTQTTTETETTPAPPETPDKKDARREAEKVAGRDKRRGSADDDDE
jgi:hypothetical protein